MLKTRHWFGLQKSGLVWEHLYSVTSFQEVLDIEQLALLMAEKLHFWLKYA